MTQHDRACHDSYDVGALRIMFVGCCILLPSLHISCFVFDSSHKAKFGTASVLLDTVTLEW